MISLQHVRTFLNDFHVKLDVWDVVYRDDRGKNSQTLADLEIRSADRDLALKALTAKDYCEGPLEEKLNNGREMWVFGREIKDKEIYIKVTLGAHNTSVICISFHIAEHPLTYPFR